jgi:chromosome partitioning protein
LRDRAIRNLTPPLSAFRAIFSFGGSLSDLDRGQVGNIPAAIANARAFAAEVLSILKPAGAREAA